MAKPFMKIISRNWHVEFNGVRYEAELIEKSLGTFKLNIYEESKDLKINDEEIVYIDDPNKPYINEIKVRIMVYKILNDYIGGK